MLLSCSVLVVCWLACFYLLVLGHWFAFFFVSFCFFFLMIRRPPRSTRTDTLFPYTTLFRSAVQLQLAIIGDRGPAGEQARLLPVVVAGGGRSEEHTSELQSLMRISYAVFCLKKKRNNKPKKLSHCAVTCNKNKESVTDRTIQEKPKREELHI